MPTSKMKVKSGNNYEVKYKVAGSMNDLSPDELKILAEKYLRTAARTYVLARLNEVEPSIAGNIKMFNDMKEAGFDAEMVDKFFANQNLCLEVPVTFELPIKELLPEEGSRGRQAADIFSFESTDDETENETESADPVEESVE